MNKICPQDQMTPLIIIERNGIEIDYCPACRGVWLDRGELEKLMDGAAQAVALASQGQPQAPQAPQAPQPQYQQPQYQQPQAPRQDPLMPPPNAYPPQPNYPQQVPPAYGAQAPYGYSGSGGYKHGRKKKRGFLDDIFDFD
jgi:uncharacterized protein